tara:strand:+ start:1098 stop:1229 length:132 start_codon:yes stop_codon:yes gene_type:complete
MPDLEFDMNSKKLVSGLCDFEKTANWTAEEILNDMDGMAVVHV